MSPEIGQQLTKVQQELSILVTLFNNNSKERRRFKLLYPFCVRLLEILDTQTTKYDLKGKRILTPRNPNWTPGDRE
jgi:hypothetical protein